MTHTFLPDWHWFSFAQMDASLLYRYLQLRQAVFMVEQRCIYPDIDGHDQNAWHLLSLTPSGMINACLRLLPPGEKYPEPSLGRIIVASDHRGTGLGHSLIAEGLRKSFTCYPGDANRIQAQAHLERFYATHGFKAFSAPYDEDGIAHVDMRTAVPAPEMDTAGQ